MHVMVNARHFMLDGSVVDPEEVQGVGLNPLPTPVFKYPMKMK